IVMYPYTSQIARDESLPLFYDTVSTDGDIISDPIFSIYYDELGNGTYTKLINTYNGPISQYTPSLNKLGKYRITVQVNETYGQDTFTEFLTSADQRSSSQQFEFEVDNYLPYSDLYTDIPSVRQQVDVSFLLDKDLEQTKIDYVKSNPVTINN